jgi:hypothetical protein
MEKTLPCPPRQPFSSARFSALTFLPTSCVRSHEAARFSSILWPLEKTSLKCHDSELSSLRMPVLVFGRRLCSFVRAQAMRHHPQQSSSSSCARSLACLIITPCAPGLQSFPPTRHRIGLSKCPSGARVVFGTARANNAGCTAASAATRRPRATRPGIRLRFWR